MIPPAIPHGLERQLREFNPRVRVRWNHERDLWVVEERGREDGKWYYVLYWADEVEGENYKTKKLVYRALPQTAGAIIERLVAIDVTRFDRQPRGTMLAFLESMDAPRRRAVEAQRKEHIDALREGAYEKFERIVAGRRAIPLNSTHLKEAAG